MDINEKFFLQIIEKVPEYIFWKDIHSIYQGCNENFAKLVGLSCPSQIIGKTDRDMPWGGYTDSLYLKEDRTIIETGRSVLRKEVPIKFGLDLQKKYLSVSKVPLYNDEKKIIGILGIFIDVTCQRKYREKLKKPKEEAENASKSKSIFIANMSHDIRTPLTGIIGMAEALESKVQTVREKEYVRNILISGERLNDLLNSILELVSSEHMDDMRVNKKIFDLRQLIQDIHDIYLLNAQAKKIDLKIEIDRLVPTLVFSDRFKLYRTLFNIIGNAIKFTEQGEIIIKVKHLEKRNNQARLEFSIADTGIGIAADFQDKVFDRFSRETPSYKGIYKGHGIGLDLAKNSMAALGSKIHLISQQGRGSTFYFELDIDIDPTEKSLQEKSPNSFNTLSSTPLTVLLIEDDEIAMMVVQMLLGKLGFSIIPASTSEEALTLAKSQQYDFILTDLGLPKMSGEEFSRHFREWEKTTGKKPVPIIALTGHGDPKVAQSCFKAGMNHVLVKPLTVATLQNTLKEFSFFGQRPIEVPCVNL
ncbi:MAG: sensory box histidine kinase/response regulator [Gammaproteobacteria bacterium]|jgi:PAS domain S-box-containing protein|nr:sensory box histidine kinase/response regulator [Gammaproteobacteria bacterium]